MTANTIGQFLMTIMLGLYESPDDYRRALRWHGCTGGHELLGNRKLKVLSTTKLLDLFLITGTELGFTDLAGKAQILERGKECGFELCPWEVGPALALAWAGRPSNDSVFVAMEPIKDEFPCYEGPHDQIFLVKFHREFGSSLSARTGFPDNYTPDSTWVFCRPHQS